MNAETLVQPALPWFGDNLLLLEEIRVDLARLGISEPVVVRASELDKLERVLVHGTDRAGYPGDRRWHGNPQIPHADVILATTFAQNRAGEAGFGASTSLRKLPIIDAPMILVYAASALEPLPTPNEYRFRQPENKPAALRAIFPITKHALPDGWFRADEGMAYRGLVELALVERALESDQPGRIVEVGCWLGRSTTYVGRLCRVRGAELSCIDTWAGSSDRFDADYREQLAARDIEAEFRAHLERLGAAATCCTRPSIEAATEFAAETVDLVFLDGSHDQAAVAADLGAWWGRLRGGGILAGHDFSDRHPGLVAAVQAFARKQGCQIRREAGSVWWVIA